VNSYIDRVCPTAGIQPDALRVRQAAEYVTRVLRVLGLSDAAPDDLGFSARSGTASREQAAEASAAAAVCVKFAQTLRDLLQGAEVPASARGKMDAALQGIPQLQQQGGSAGGGGESGEGGELSKYLRGKDADEVVDELVAVRDEVRAAAREAGPAKGEIMRVCDEVRDVALVDIGIKLEDAPSGGIWMRVDPTELRNEVRT
jgi:cysteinyl-tRNA synthetase